MTSSRFDSDITSTRSGEGRWTIDISPDWKVNVGPNGGFIGAIMLRALREELDYPQTRSATVHFLSASVPGPAEVQTEIVKKGRSLSTATARLIQNDRVIAILLTTFGSPRDLSVNFSDLVMPEVAQPEDIPPEHHMSGAMMTHSEFRDHFDQRLAIGPIPPDVTEQARVGGWTRFRDARLFDDEAIVTISDSWFPSLLAKPFDEPVHAPTVDHTVHFLAELPLADNKIDDFLLVEFETEIASQGYLIESGNIWSSTGQLIARSRQLAVILPR